MSVVGWVPSPRISLLPVLTPSTHCLIPLSTHSWVVTPEYLPPEYSPHLSTHPLVLTPLEYPIKGPSTRDTHPLLERTWDPRYSPPVDRMTDRRLWKHYLPQLRTAIITITWDEFIVVVQSDVETMVTLATSAIVVNVVVVRVTVAIVTLRIRTT